MSGRSVVLLRCGHVVPQRLARPQVSDGHHLDSATRARDVSGQRSTTSWVLGSWDRIRGGWLQCRGHGEHCGTGGAKLRGPDVSTTRTSVDHDGGSAPGYKRRRDEGTWAKPPCATSLHSRHAVTDRLGRGRYRELPNALTEDVGRATDPVHRAASPGRCRGNAADSADGRVRYRRLVASTGLTWRHAGRRS